MEKYYIDELNRRLTEASMRYYSGKESQMTDTDFDLKLNELKHLQEQTGYTPENSITLRIGSDLQKEFKKLEHPEPMLTIDNTYDDEALEKWISDMQKKYDPKQAEISTKFDGVSLEIHYKNGEFISASTRGDKMTGDDVSQNAKTILSIPLKLNETSGYEDIYVRGEVLMPRSVLRTLNASSVKKFANCRNAASGSLKQLDARVTAKRGLIFRPWDVLFYSNKKDITQIDKSSWLDSNGFQVEDFARMQTVEFSKNIIKDVESFKERLKMSNPDWDYDGVVIKVSSDALRDEIGSSDHRAIQWGIARKWNEERIGITILESVSWQVGSTGILTPVGNLRPIPLDGVTVTNVTLHNMDFIRKNNLQKNAPIRITRSGGVIPYVQGRPSDAEFLKSYPEFLLKTPEDITVPEVCPICGAKITDDKCTNSKCPGILQGKIENWCSKEIMDIDGIGPEIIKDLLLNGLISWPLDLYKMAIYMRPDEILSKLGQGYGMTTVNNIISSIKASMSKPLETIIAGMGIPGIGKENAKSIAREFKSLDAIIHARVEDITAIDGIGNVLAVNIRKWMDDNGHDWLQALDEFGMKTEIDSPELPKGNELEGLKVVFSGSSQSFKGDECESYLESHGAKCSHSVSSKTDYLITGIKPGQSKVDKAIKSNVTIISEEEFFTKFSIIPS